MDDFVADVESNHFFLVSIPGIRRTIEFCLRLNFWWNSATMPRVVTPIYQQRIPLVESQSLKDSSFTFSDVSDLFTTHDYTYLDSSLDEHSLVSDLDDSFICVDVEHVDDIGPVLSSSRTPKTPLHTYTPQQQNASFSGNKNSVGRPQVRNGIHRHLIMRDLIVVPLTFPDDFFTSTPRIFTLVVLLFHCWATHHVFHEENVAVQLAFTHIIESFPWQCTF